MHDRPPVAHQGVDQAALADVGAACHDDLPRLDQVPAQRCAGHERVDLLSGGGPLPPWMAARIASIARPRAPWYWSKRIAAVRVVRASAKASCAAAASGSACCAATHSCHASGRQPDATRTCLDHGHRGVAAVAVQLDRLGRAAADDDFLTRFDAESPDGQSLSGCGSSRPSAAGVEVCGDRPHGPRPFDQQRRHRPAPGRRQ